MKTFQEFILEASCNGSPKGMDCPTHGTAKCPKVKSHKTVEAIATKHRLDVSFIEKQLKMGIPIEHEHTKDKALATDIALQHLDEIPDYYTRLKKMEASAKKEHKKFKDVKETVTIEDANGNTFLEIIDLIKPEKMKGISEAKKKTLRNTNPCWDKYKPIGTKKLHGKTVPNCVPVDEGYTRIQSRGSTYSILLNWRGKYLSVQMFFPQFARPPKDQVTFEVRKIYPGAIVLSFNPSVKDPTKPLLFTGDENESRRH